MMADGMKKSEVENRMQRLDEKLNNEGIKFVEKKKEQETTKWEETGECRTRDQGVCRGREDQGLRFQVLKGERAPLEGEGMGKQDTTREKAWALEKDGEMLRKWCRDSKVCGKVLETIRWRSEHKEEMPSFKENGNGTEEEMPREKECELGGGGEDGVAALLGSLLDLATSHPLAQEMKSSANSMVVSLLGDSGPGGHVAGLTRSLMDLATSMTLHPETLNLAKWFLKRVLNELPRRSYPQGLAHPVHSPAQKQEAQTNGGESESAGEKARRMLHALLHVSRTSRCNPACVDVINGLVTNLMDGLIKPKDFRNRITEEYRSHPEPYASNFLQVALPHLRQVLGEQLEASGPTQQGLGSPASSTGSEHCEKESESDVARYLLEFLVKKHQCMEGSEQSHDHEDAEEGDEGHHFSEEEEEVAGGEVESNEWKEGISSEEEETEESEESDDSEAGHRPRCRKGHGRRMRNGKGRHRGNACQNRGGKRGMGRDESEERRFVNMRKRGRSRSGFRTRRKFCPRKCKAIVEFTGAAINVTRLWCKGRKEKEIIAQRASCLGCAHPLPLKHRNVKWTALQALHKYNVLRQITNSFDIDNITSATRQVVHGILFHVEFTAIETGCSFEELQHTVPWKMLHDLPQLHLHHHHAATSPSVSSPHHHVIPPHPPNSQHQPHHSTEKLIKEKVGALKETSAKVVDQKNTSCPHFPPGIAQVLSCIGTCLILPSKTSVTVCCDVKSPTSQAPKPPSIRGTAGIGPFRSPPGTFFETRPLWISNTSSIATSGKSMDQLSCNRETVPPQMEPQPDNSNPIHEEDNPTIRKSMDTFSDEDLLG
uniref:TAFH domain-containing protein n=1 Tax=Eptatretus burgeri TaxID=7764 RepID=A0A8C4QUG5_EPTBU